MFKRMAPKATLVSESHRLLFFSTINFFKVGQTGEKKWLYLFEINTKNESPIFRVQKEKDYLNLIVDLDFDESYDDSSIVKLDFSALNPVDLKYVSQVEPYKIRLFIEYSKCSCSS